MDSLSLFNFEKDIKLRIDNFRISTEHVQLGENLHFEFELNSLKSTAQKLVVDYAIHYVKASGEHSKKVFKLKEVSLLPDQTLKFSKNQLFKDLTTRKHYKGKHLIEIIVNGRKLEWKEFNLTIQ
ncbi:hypothetical protein D3C87_1639090 [compost metagenome]